MAWLSKKSALEQAQIKAKKRAPDWA